MIVAGLTRLSPDGRYGGYIRTAGMWQKAGEGTLNRVFTWLSEWHDHQRIAFPVEDYEQMRVELMKGDGYNLSLSWRHKNMM